MGTLGDLRMAKRQCGWRYVGRWSGFNNEVIMLSATSTEWTASRSAGCLEFPKAVGHTALTVDHLPISVIDASKLA
ncbi:hypothetical protein [Bradyrhizobium lablabi]|uniref:hypothetical protein n=1 Tax=Bradyrhizobium lablabi TaxID=722472 RepID=UPI001BAC09A2|nr:hypothetical protein [Bradyrhizobium lablabi]MBR0696609.1 hypothetical protein [Bradyrhizobium lablabi]